nr:DUF402 domain-containing protein [Corynebacterium lactis]
MPEAATAHAPKVETFDIVAGVNVDPKGFHRTVDEFRLLADNVLYMRRGMDHPKFGYLESFLLADGGLRISIYHFRPGTTVEHVRYVDIVSVDRSDASRWRVKDLYLDIVQSPVNDAEVAPIPLNAETTIKVEDVDELVAAHQQGLIDDDETERAISTALEARAAIAAAGDDIDTWLASLELGLHWADNVVLAPAMSAN